MSGGDPLTLEPVSTRNHVLVCASCTKNRRLGIGPVALVAASVRPKSFPNCRSPGTFWQLHQTWPGTNKAACWERLLGRGCEDVQSLGDCSGVGGGWGVRQPVWQGVPLLLASGLCRVGGGSDSRNRRSCDCHCLLSPIRGMGCWSDGSCLASNCCSHRRSARSSSSFGENGGTHTTE